MMALEEEKKVITFSYNDAPTLKRFALSDKFIRAIIGPFGSGKSSACVIEIPRRGRMQKRGPDGIRRTRWAVIRNTYMELKDTTMKTFFEWLPPEHFGTYNKQDHIYTIDRIPGCHIEVLFRALDIPKHARKLLSLELTGAWINEFREIHPRIFEDLQGRVRRYPAKKDGGYTWSGIIMDSNPPDEDSYYFNLFEKKRPENTELFHQPSGLSDKAENLKNQNAEDYYTNLAIGKDKEYIHVCIHGNYGYLPEGEAVVPEYVPTTHRSSEILRPMPGALGVRFWDGGLYPACVIAQVLPSGVMNFYRTFCEKNIGMRQLIKTYVKPYLSYYFREVTTWRDFGDPALRTREQSDSEKETAAKVIEEELKTSFEGGVSDWNTRREGLKELMNRNVSGQPLFRLSREDTLLHKVLRGGWRYAMTADGRTLKNKPVKDAYSHPGDAISHGIPLLLGLDLKSSGRVFVEETFTPLDEGVGY